MYECRCAIVSPGHFTIIYSEWTPGPFAMRRNMTPIHFVYHFVDCCHNSATQVAATSRLSYQSRKSNLLAACSVYIIFSS